MSHHDHDRDDDRDHDHEVTTRHVRITVEHESDRTEAKAHMRWRKADLVGVGEATIDPDDRYPKRVGEELAVARALTHLTRQLFVTTAGDIESVTGEETSVR
jgi:Domain of unknown function (DUF1876)